jgi:hypothetical protein
MFMNAANETPSLRGKTVAIHLRDRPIMPPVVLSDCSLETRGGRIFLVGMSLPVQRDGKEWSDGVRRAVAWDAVDEYLLFQSPDDFYAHELPAPPVAASAPAAGIPANVPLFESPKGLEGYPVEPSGIGIEPETPLEVGSVVLSFSQGRWWRAEVVGLEGDDLVTIHYPGWDSKWDVTVLRGELQVYLGDSIQNDDHLA